MPQLYEKILNPRVRLIQKITFLTIKTKFKVKSTQQTYKENIRKL